MADAPATADQTKSDPAHDAWLKDTLNLDPSGYGGPGKAAERGAPGGDSAGTAAPGGGGPGNGTVMSKEDASTFAVKSVVTDIEDMIGMHPSPKVIGASQQKQADAKIAKLSVADQAAFKDILDKSGSDKAKAYITKGLASGHSISELQAFAAKIAGKDDDWMQDNLSLTDDTHGKGVKQQWQMSCNATTAQAVKGMFDPLYALKMHEDSPKLEEVDKDNPDNLNPKLAAEQKSMLLKPEPDGYVADAQPINNTDKTLMKGRWNTDLLNDAKGVTGLEYTQKQVGTDEERTAGMTEMDKQLADGNPVPIVVGDGSATGKFAHYILVTSTDPGPPRTYTIHDPASGKSYLRNDQQLKTGHIDIAGWNKLSAFELPKPVPVT